MSSTKLAHSIIRNLLELGVTHFVLSPGSRNSPLSLALVEASEQGLIDLHVRIDERGAGFYALGISKATENYVALVCTSGTAAANYHPSALESYHSNSKVIFITADRPARLRETGANQTTIQTNLLAPVKCHDISSALDIASVLDGGPLHLNVQFDEPLISESNEKWLDGIEVNPYFQEDFELVDVEAAPRAAIIVGHDKGGFSDGEIEDFLADCELPVISEDPLTTFDAVPHASLFLADPEIRQALRADELFVIGRTTLSRSINSYISECDKVTVIDPRLESVDKRRDATRKLNALPFIGGIQDEDWLNKWDSLLEIELSIDKWSEQEAISTIINSIPEGSALFVGSSRPVRDIEAISRYRAGIRTFANRGLAGIDGNISTAWGISECFERSYSILGDLTFLHDISALVNPVSSNHCIFVIDNNGGGIFSTLPQAGTKGFEEVFGTPHGLNLESIAESFGISVTRAKNSSDIDLQINKSGLRIVIIEVPSRDENAAFVKELHQRAAKAARMGINLA